MKGIDFKTVKNWETVVVNGSLYLFTCLRIDRKTIPEGLYAYDVRDSDDCDGSFAQVKEYVMVNHWGTMIGKCDLPLDENGAFYPGENWSYGEGYMTAEKYLQKY